MGIVEPQGYVGSSIWVSRLVESTTKHVPLPTVPAAIFTIGVIPIALTGLFLLLANGPFPRSFLIGQALAASIAVVGPGLIWHFDERVFPNFAMQVTDVVADRDALMDVIGHYERFSTHRYWLVAAPWTALILIVLLANIEFFVNLGVSGYLDPALFVYLLFATWWSILTGIGLHGVVTAILCVRAVGDLELVIDPLHHDGLGGLSTIGYFSIRATLMNSIGSLALPLAFSIATEGGSETLVYTAVVIYIGFILASFVYPTFYVNRRAQEIRERILEEKRAQIRALQQKVSIDSTGGELTDLERQLKIQMLRDDFQEYRRVNLYPLSISILVRLASSILLPILLTVLDTYVFSA